MLENTIDLTPYTKLVLDTAVPLLVTVIGTLVTVSVARVNAWLRSKVHNETFQCASNRLDKLVGDAVLEAESTLVREYKAAAADGKLSKSDGEKVRDDVLDVVKRHLGDKGQKELLGCLGHIDFSVVEGMIRTRIEAAVMGAGAHARASAAADEALAAGAGSPALKPPRTVSSGEGPTGVKPAPSR